MPADQVAQDQLRCSNCGAPIPPGRPFCPQCLAPTSKTAPVRTAPAGKPAERVPAVAPPESTIPPGEPAFTDTSTPPDEHAVPAFSIHLPTVPPLPPIEPFTPSTDKVSPSLPDFKAYTTPAVGVPLSAALPIPAVEPAVPAVKQGLLCGDCFGPMQPSDSFCPQCGAPASLAMPMGAVIAALLRKKAELGRQQLARSLRAAAEATLAASEKAIPVSPPLAKAAPVELPPAKQAGAPAPRVIPPPARTAPPSSPPAKQAAASAPPATPLSTRTTPVPTPPLAPAKQAPRQLTEKERLLREAQITFLLSAICWFALIVTWGNCVWFAAPLAVYCLWRGNKLRQHVHQDVAREGTKAFAVSIVFLVVAFFVIVAKIAR